MLKRHNKLWMLGPRSAFNHLSFIIIAISLSYLLGYGARDILATCTNPKLINTTWEQIDNPDSVGWSTEKLREACEYSQTIQTAALILIYRGKVLYHWGEIDRKFWVHSIRKPFLSALYGIHCVLSASVRWAENFLKRAVRGRVAGFAASTLPSRIEAR